MSETRFTTQDELKALAAPSLDNSARVNPNPQARDWAKPGYSRILVQYSIKLPLTGKNAIDTPANFNKAADNPLNDLYEVIPEGEAICVIVAETKADPDAGLMIVARSDTDGQVVAKLVGETSADAVVAVN